MAGAASGSGSANPGCRFVVEPQEELLSLMVPNAVAANPDPVVPTNSYRIHRNQSRLVLVDYRRRVLIGALSLLRAVLGLQKVPGMLLCG